MSTFHEISECIGFLRVLQSGCFTCLSQDASSLSSSNIWTQGFEGKRDRRRMGFREFVVPEILQEICWNRRTLHGPVLRHILHQFYLHFLTYAPWYGMAPKSSNKRFWQDGVSLLLLSLITSTLRWRSQDGRWTSRVDFWRPTSWQVVWKNSLLHIQETVEVQHVITCWHVREAQHVTNRIRPPPKPIMWDLFACSLCHVYIYIYWIFCPSILSEQLMICQNEAGEHCRTRGPNHFQAVDVRILRWLWPSLHLWIPLVSLLALMVEVMSVVFGHKLIMTNSVVATLSIHFHQRNDNLDVARRLGDSMTRWLGGGAPWLFVLNLWLLIKINAVPEDKFQYATYKSDTVWNQRGVDWNFTFLHLVPANMNWMLWCFFWTWSGQPIFLLIIDWI